MSVMDQRDAAARDLQASPSNDLRILCIWALVGCCACLLAGLLLDRTLAGPTAPTARTYAVLPEASDRIRSYFTQRNLLYVGGTVWFLVGLYACIRFRLADRALRLSGVLVRHRFLAACVVWVALATFVALWTLPPAIISTAIERSFGLSTIGPGLWTADRLRDWALDLIWAPLIGGAWLLIHRSPERWWLWLGLGLVPVGIAMTLVVPVVVDPMYNAYAPLRNERLRSAIRTMATKAGLHDPVVLESVRSSRTTKANAYVTGIGPTHRVVIWDTTLRRLPDEQVAAIAAHELGHYRYHHIWWGLGLYTIGGFVVLKVLHSTMPRLVRVLGGAGLDDPRSIPVAYLGLTIVLMIQTPAAAGISRVMERQADAYGLALCGDGDATARAFASFSKTDLAHPDPPRALVLWYYTHPPLRERVARALAFDDIRSRAGNPSGLHVNGLPH